VEPTVATFGTQRPLAFILPVLIKLLSEPLNIAVRVEAPRVLARLIEKDPSLQKDAGDSEAVNRLIDYLTDTNNMAGALPSSQQLAQLHESALMALSGLCATSESTRSLVVGAGAMPHIARGLEHTSKVVRVAACHCIRVLARSVKLVRTALVDCAISRPLFHLLQDDALDVVASASATICNVLLDHSPIKEAALCEGGLARLAALATSMDSTVRLNCIWALKNFSYQAKLADKAKVLQVMEWERLYELLTDESVMIREQALGLVRNLVCGGEDVCTSIVSCLYPCFFLFFIL
jgi:HEAT repeat protein